MSEWDEAEDLDFEDEDSDDDQDYSEEDDEDDEDDAPLPPPDRLIIGRKELANAIPVEKQPPAQVLPAPQTEKAGDPTLSILKRNVEATVRKVLTLDNAQGKKDLFDARAQAAKDGDLVALEEAVRQFEMSEARLDKVRAVVPEMLADKLDKLFLELDRRLKEAELVKDRRN